MFKGHKLNTISNYYENTLLVEERVQEISKGKEVA